MWLWLCAPLVLWFLYGVSMFFKRSSLRTFPMAPGHWLLGQIPALSGVIQAGDHFDTFLAKLQRSMGKNYTMNLVTQKFLVISDPDAVKETLVTKNYPKSPTYEPLLGLVGESSMLVADEETWRRWRDMFNPVFHLDVLNRLIPIISSKTKDLCEILDKAAVSGEVVHLHHRMTLLTLDIMATIILEKDYNLQREGESHPLYCHLMALIDTANFYMESPHLGWTRYLPWVAKKINDQTLGFDTYLLGELSDLLEKHPPEQQKVERTGGRIKFGGPADAVVPLIPGALAVARLEGWEPPMQGVLSQVKTLVFGGHDTTASTIAFAVYEIARHPEVEAKLLQELAEVLPADAEPTSSNLNQMKYLTAVVKETLRLWPAATSARYIAHGTLQGYDVSRCVQYVPNFVVQHDPDYWGPDAEEFRPERWQDESYMAAVHPYAYFPFSKGPRDCIGQTFALLEAKAVLALLVRRYHFKYAREGEEVQATRITPHPKYGCPVLVTRR